MLAEGKSLFEEQKKEVFVVFLSKCCHLIFWNILELNLYGSRRFHI